MSNVTIKKVSLIIFEIADLSYFEAIPLSYYQNFAMNSMKISNTKAYDDDIELPSPRQRNPKREASFTRMRSISAMLLHAKFFSEQKALKSFIVSKSSDEWR